MNRQECFGCLVCTVLVVCGCAHSERKTNASSTDGSALFVRELALGVRHDALRAQLDAGEISGDEFRLKNMELDLYEHHLRRAEAIKAHRETIEWLTQRPDGETQIRAARDFWLRRVELENALPYRSSVDRNEPPAQTIAELYDDALRQKEQHGTPAP